MAKPLPSIGAGGASSRAPLRLPDIPGKAWRQASSCTAGTGITVPPFLGKPGDRTRQHDRKVTNTLHLAQRRHIELPPVTPSGARTYRRRRESRRRHPAVSRTSDLRILRCTILGAWGGVKLIYIKSMQA